MNILLSCIGKRGYMARLFREHLSPRDRIVGTSNSPWTPGFLACDEGVVMPDVAHPSYPDAVLELCRSRRIDVLLSFFDPDVHRLSRLRDALSAEGVRCFIPGPEAADISFDKVRTGEFLESLGLPSVRTFTCMADAREALRNGEVRFPLFVKPRRGFGSRNTFQARDEMQLAAFLTLEEDMIAQETIGGEEYDFDVLNDLSGRPVSIVPWRKLASRMGETQLAETVHSPELVALGHRVAAALGHAGPLDADLFVDRGVVRVLEINLRFGGGYPVSHLAGADFPAAILAMARGEPLSSSIGTYLPGVVMTKELAILGGPRDAFLRDALHVDKAPVAPPVAATAAQRVERPLDVPTTPCTTAANDPPGVAVAALARPARAGGV
jgi:carbamoyl-phosphate synthase large subunit